MRWMILVIAVLALFPSAAMAVSEGAPAALQPLLTPSARASAMGQAFVAVADDATATYWNPAALARRYTPSLALMYSKLVPDLADDIGYYHFAYSRPGWGGSLGFSVIFLSFGKSTIVHDDGSSGGDFSSFDFVPQFSYGANLNDRLALGFSFKFIYSKLADPIPELAISDGTGKSIAGDISALYSIPEVNVDIGAIFQNLGPNLAYNDEDQAEDLPRALRLGAAWSPVITSAAASDGTLLHQFLVTGEVTKPLVNADDEAIFKGGAEYEFYDFIALRFGYVDDSDGDITDFTYGAGFSLRRHAKIGLRFDFASFPQATDLDRVNRFALSYDF